LNAAKSLGKGLRELGEQVAAGLVGGNVSISAGSNSSNANFQASVPAADGSQPGVVTILDIKHPIKDISPTSGTPVAVNGNDPIIAHFLAHTEAIYAMSFDPSGMLLLTADKRGHDFNVFRIQPHPCGSVLAAVHHLYVLHRGDTSAKVQDISFSFDSRWVAVSTVRGTTHVFPTTPYGGPCGFRTHSAPHVVNRLSRFHRSAGLAVDGRSSSPILMEHAANSTAHANPRLPPFPHPTVILPLAQLRQPTTLNSASALMSQTTTSSTTQQSSKGYTSRQRLHSSTEESHSKPLRVAAVFAKARSYLLDPPGMV
jgi:breast carcinoma-amplified sequence 3